MKQINSSDSASLDCLSLNSTRNSFLPQPVDSDGLAVCSDPGSDSQNSSIPKPHHEVSKIMKSHKMIKKVVGLLLLTCGVVGVLYLASEYLFHAGGLGRINFLVVTDYFYSEEMTLPLSFREGYSAGKTATFFKTGKSLAEISNQIAEITDPGEYKIELFDENNLLIRKTIKLGSDREAIYLLRKNVSKNGFYLFNLSAEFISYNPADKANSASVRIIFPYHLVNDERFDNKYAGFALGELYETEYRLDDFYQFYHSLNTFAIEKNDQIIKIKGYMYDTTLSPHLPAFSTPVAISFVTENNQTRFRVTLVD